MDFIIRGSGGRITNRAVQVTEFGDIIICIAHGKYCIMSTERLKKKATELHSVAGCETE